MLRILVFFLLLIPIFGLAQRPQGAGTTSQGITGSVSGRLIDSLTRQPAEYVAIGVLDAATGNVVNGALSDSKGAFRITGLSPGTYKLQVSFIGFTTQDVLGIVITPAQPDYDAGTIILSPESQLLEEIRVVGEAALIEARPDKIVYNAERDVTSRGGDAADVLRKVPLLSVDFDGNVSLRGSENVQVLINGRPSAMFKTNIADALRMLPADQIQSVEVITAPSARFDGEGTAGIINIITKKKNIEGLAGSVDLTGGTRVNRGNASVNYGKGRFGLNASGGGHYSWPQTGRTSFRREELSQLAPGLLLQDGTNRSSRLGFRSQLGMEYNFNAYNTLNASVSYRGFDVRTNNQVSSNYMVSNAMVDSYLRKIDGTSVRGGLDLGLDFRRTMKKKDQEWSAAVEVEIDDNRSESDLDFLYSFPAGQPDRSETNNNIGDNLEFTFQTDYTHPFNERLKLETGLKGTLRRITSDFNFSSFNFENNQWLTDPNRTDIFYYDQNVYAGYASANWKMGKRLNLISGARIEVTELSGDFEQFVSPFSNTYTNLLPSVTLSSKVGEFNQVRISYNQRIQRPNQRHINPFIDISDNRDISFGNPTLAPELVHQVELGTNVFIKGNMLNVSLFGRRIEDLIESLVRVSEEGISETTFSNFGKRSSLGVNVFASVNIGSKLSLRGGFDVNAWEASGLFLGQQLANTGYDYNGRLNMTWSLSETLKVEGFGFFRSPTFTVQGRNPNWSMMSFGIKKELLNKRLTLGLNFTEPFRENMIFVREITGTGFYQYSRTARPIRSFGINAGYRFGKLDVKERSGKKRGGTNDVKDDDRGSEGQF